MKQLLALTLLSVPLSGQTGPFSEFKGAPTVVIFISTKCHISNAYNERMNALYQDYSAKGVKLLFVNANSNENETEVTEHAKANGFAFPVHKDIGNTLADRFGAQATPTAYVIDPSGILRYRGFIDDSPNPARIHVSGLRTALDSVLAGKPVAVAETKAFGCSIKRVKKVTAPESTEHLTKLDEDGYQILLDSRKGNVILVVFWATWCEPCRKELPELVRLESKLQAQRLKLIVISADELEQEADAQRLLRKLSIPPPAYRKQPKNDNAFINAIDPKWSGALPALFLYDRKGRRVRSFIGETPMADVEGAVSKLL